MFFLDILLYIMADGCANVLGSLSAQSCHKGQQAQMPVDIKGIENKK